MRRFSLILMTLLLLSGLALADGAVRKHRRVGRPCGPYTIYKHKKIHYRVGRPCGHRRKNAN
jgi:hypothetical protein